MRIIAFGASDRGAVRDNNEDSYAIVLPPDVTPGLAGLLVVADGLGGHQAGEVASRMVVDGLLDWFGSGGMAESHNDPEDTGQSWGHELDQALRAIHRAVQRYATADRRHAGMGSTAVVAALSGDQLILANVGDSRAYLLAGGTFRQISEDQTWVAAEVRAGRLSAEEARTHPRRNLLIQAVGVGEEVEPKIQGFPVQPGDQVLLCSDGVSNLISEDEFRELLRRHGEPRRVVPALIHLALTRSAPDNVTVVVGKVQR